jgi:uncharacterized protein
MRGFSYTADMKNEFDVRALHVLAFARLEGRHAGEEKLHVFPRLMEESQGLGGETRVSYEVAGHVQQDATGLEEPWIRLGAQAMLALTCQRCLGLADVLVQFERDFRFVASEELAAVEDEESEEDVLVLSKSLNLLDLIEDELIMSVPPVPKHAQCPQTVKMQASDADFEGAHAEKPNPFAVLQKLKDGGLG